MYSLYAIRGSFLCNAVFLCFCVPNSRILTFCNMKAFGGSQINISKSMKFCLSKKKKATNIVQNEERLVTFPELFLPGC